MIISLNRKQGNSDVLCDQFLNNNSSISFNVDSLHSNAFTASQKSIKPRSAGKLTAQNGEHYSDLPFSCPQLSENRSSASPFLPLLFFQFFSPDVPQIRFLLLQNLLGLFTATASLKCPLTVELLQTQSCLFCLCSPLYPFSPLLYFPARSCAVRRL